MGNPVLIIIIIRTLRECYLKCRFREDAGEGSVPSISEIILVTKESCIKKWKHILSYPPFQVHTESVSVCGPALRPGYAHFWG